MYCRVVLIDALSGDEIRELGWFCRDFAIEFCQSFCARACKKSGEFRLAVIAEHANSCVSAA